MSATQTSPSEAPPPAAAPPGPAKPPAAKPAPARKPAPKPIDRTATAADVVAAYRLLLGREPESEAVVAAHLAAAPEIGALRDRIMGSAEFQRVAYGAVATPTIRRAAGYDPVPMEIEVSAKDTEKMQAQARRIWTRLGQERPFFSILPERRFSPDFAARNAEAFQKTGRDEIEVLKRRLTALEIDPADHPEAVEYGCGVGRVTVPLSVLFRKVTGFDISQPHIDLAQQAVRGAGRKGVSLSVVKDIRALDVPQHDFFYTRMVLHRNPPPLQAQILRRCLGRMRVGGIAVFQLLTHLEGYTYDTAAWLAAKPAEEPEVHVLRQDIVFGILKELGFQPLHVARDHSLPGFDRISTQFIARRVRLD
ncbi:class I SAM-dependent methyltransferase [Falsiroseomonas ponticola]|uniref:class I SAM-dependent methyltransferase n=1 Tax=Falsiroseomonas ponticola TaxID=2786951 RepID=UPI001933FC02|nr:class I SAM-dependent methyltransferase [Roseomonas ponticola]